MSLLPTAYIRGHKFVENGIKRECAFSMNFLKDPRCITLQCKVSHQGNAQKGKQIALNSL